MDMYKTTSSINIVCAYKFGNGFDVNDVELLYENVSEHLECDFNFICHTNSRYHFHGDILVNKIGPDLDGWWNKMACFRMHGPCLYLDLDTVILSSLNNFIDELMSQEYYGHQKRKFWMLDAFNKNRDWASGVMAWTGVWSWLWELFLVDRPTGWDQNYIKTKVGNILSINDYVDVVSYKHHCNRKTGQAPESADIVCFHGRPRPRDLKFRVWK